MPKSAQKKKREPTLGDLIRAYERADNAFYRAHDNLVSALKTTYGYDSDEDLDYGVLTAIAGDILVAADMSQRDDTHAGLGKITIEDLPEAAITKDKQ